MYSGPHNDAVVPFIPAQYTLNYVLVGIVLLSSIFAILKISKTRMGPIPALCA